jgi:hypothetical protein
MNNKSPVQTFFTSWKAALEILHDNYIKYAGGATGSILTIVATIVFSFDKIGKLGWFEKSSICGVLFLLALAVGNLLNCLVFSTNEHLKLLCLERLTVLDDTKVPSQDDLKQLEDSLTKKHADAQVFFRYGYTCILIAGLLAVIASVRILWKS